MRLPTQRKRRTLQEINAVAERYWQSGLTQKTFARQEGVCVATLAKYLRVAAKQRQRSAGPSQPGALVEVRRLATGTITVPFAGEHIRICFPNGIAVGMAAAGCDLGALLKDLFALR